jgi:hypothetical protein
MFESPLLQKLIAEKLHEAIREALKARFGSVPQDVPHLLREILDHRKLKRLAGIAATCSDLQAFREALPS